MGIDICGIDIYPSFWGIYPVGPSRYFTEIVPMPNNTIVIDNRGLYMYIITALYSTIYAREAVSGKNLSQFYNVFVFFEIFMVWLLSIWLNLGFAGSCDYLLNKYAQNKKKKWFFFTYQRLYKVAHEHTRRIGAMRLSCSKQNKTKQKTCFQKKVDIKK